MVISLIFWAIGASLNALMDMSYQMWGKSILKEKGLNPKFWYLVESSKHAKRIFGTTIDAWHVAKLLMLGSILIAMVTYTAQWYYILIFPFAWGLSFEVTKYFLTIKKYR